MENVNCTFYFEDMDTNRKDLFEQALRDACHGRVLYISYEELNELPLLSQELNSLNKHYLRMISFLYVKNLDSLLESISTLPDWKNIPTTLILDDLGTYCDKNNLQNACGLVALLINTAQCCSSSLQRNVKVCISLCKKTLGDDYCNLLQELYIIQHNNL